MKAFFKLYCLVSGMLVGALALACVAGFVTAWWAPDWLAPRGARLLVLLDNQIHDNMPSAAFTDSPEPEARAPLMSQHANASSPVLSQPKPLSVAPVVDVSALVNRLENLKEASLSSGAADVSTAIEHAIEPRLQPTSLYETEPETESPPRAEETKPLSALTSLRSRAIAHLLGESDDLDDSLALEIFTSLPVRKGEEVLECMSILYPSRASQLVRLMVREETEGKP